MKIFIRTLTAETFTLNVESNESILSVKHKIETAKTYPVKQQRLLYDGKSLCPKASLNDYDIKNESTLHLVLQLGCGAEAADTLLTNICMQSINIKYLNHILLLNNDEWTANLTKIIMDYSPFINLNVLQIDPICMAANGQSNRRNNKEFDYCSICKRWMYQKPYINHNKTENIIKYKISDNIGHFYGLFIKFVFRKYVTAYNRSWSFETDINSIHNKNINQYIKITDSINALELKYRLYDIDKYYDKLQVITIKIDEDMLKTEKVRKLFKNNKLKVNVLIKEKELPAIYHNLNDKGHLIGDINLQHYIYKI